jgi:hypothetical protein
VYSLDEEDSFEPEQEVHVVVGNHCTALSEVVVATVPGTLFAVAAAVLDVGLDYNLGDWEDVVN